jgi:hypothetical protein
MKPSAFTRGQQQAFGQLVDLYYWRTGSRLTLTATTSGKRGGGRPVARRVDGVRRLSHDQRP